MKTRYFPSNCYRVVPIQTTEKHEVNEWKQLISQLVSMNKGFLEKGAGKVINKSTGEQEYRDVPHFSIKLLKQDDKIHTFMNLPKDKDHLLETRLKQALYKDIGQIRVQEEPIKLPEKHLTAFAIRGHYHPAINLEANLKIKELIHSIDHAMYCLTVKEFKDHGERRNALKLELLGITDTRSLVLHEAKEMIKTGSKWMVDFWLEKETKQKWEAAIQQFQKLLPMKKKPALPFTERKLSSPKNRFLMVEVLFLLWTDDEKKAKQFQTDLQKLMTNLQGENFLEVVRVKPDLKKVSKGRIQYHLPTLCLYQAELDKFLLLPDVEDKDFYSEIPEKTIIPEYALKYEVGAIALGITINTNEIIAMPRTASETDLDDRGMPTLISGKKGSGKTQLIINQVADTFCLGAKSLEEWREKARSTIVIDVADGDMIREIYELVPEELKNRVVILNHADIDNPLPITNHDVLNINKTDGFEEEIASMETEMLMDSLKDKNNTIAVERHFKTALQASYLAGKGNLIDAMQILESAAYRSEIIKRLQDREDNVFLPKELEKMNSLDDSTMDTIDNRISRVKSIQPWIDVLSQAPTEGLDFWKWINGDENGAYLVLIYIPKRTNKGFRKFLFAHYLTKIWYMTEARETISKSDRKEFLVIVDELHQIFGHRAVPIVLEQIYKEARKYRSRFIFTVHGWSSIKDKETQNIIKDGSGNYIALKGGSDLFNSLKEEFEPYTTKDFTSLMNMDYTGIFKIDIKKKTHVFQAKLMEPASVRFKKHRHLSLEQLRAMKNQYGRPKNIVRAAMRRGWDEPCQQTQPQEQQNLRQQLEEELAVITGGRGSRRGR